ncbi:NADPH-dependent 2,4-dienoyl-CoA reductase/sulfur reductase-like enzyme [Nocardioides zeae]|uniref:NADPH-dependent 2,4-dienoyl-CoA reductase/sulfur reductase-like enzyme n=1 Tax=Nocardioides zeae TaxID=1457234 RepID=A0ACC6IE44_9ACTN|nr:FAD-dependent oxidoreductase [Nocardioides zeae]MDR6174081.1 NADPH-dependent 2,4-dienoyl-CoA reductase/sulfur reductase-like enzyme [Nocardioides zeae]MDR6208888.1 NADPH-dependent 2,4-dienoyl-CoA reductase/sulfur reductase-like enzyme [Nocardioides zeae]
MTVQRLVVVGASLAGLRAVEAARRAGYDGELVLVGDEVHAPYDRPPLSKAFLDLDGQRGAGQVMELSTAEALRDELRVDLRLGVRATGLDTAAREVLLGDERLPYDALVIATGSVPRWLPGTDPDGPDGPLEGVTQLRTVDDARRVREALEAGARLVVVGAGFIGSEVASAARKRGLPVTVVEALDVPLTRSVGPEVGVACVGLHRAAGTDLRLGVGVAGLDEETSDGPDGRRRVRAVRLTDGTTLPADLVVLGIGVRPATAWLEGSGVALHEGDRGVLVDATMATNVPGVWAAGDVAHVENPLFDGEQHRLEHWTNAADHGAAAARHALDPAAAEPVVTVPYFWSDWYGHRLQFVGTPRAEEARVVVDELATGGGLVVLYRREDRVVGAFVVDLPRVVMKLRRRVLDRGPWEEAVAFATGSEVPTAR